MTITQTVDIPASRRVFFDFEVPREIPTGRAWVEFKVIPFVNNEDKPTQQKTEASPSSVASPTPISDSLVGFLSGMGDIDLDEMRMERLSKHLK